jgi:transcriptional regulator with XRE-family HTH domain
MSSEAAAWREVGHAVATRRLSLGMPTQQDLGERSGVHKNTISRLELGQLRRRGKKWSDIEAALEWPAGRLTAMYREFLEHSGRVPADAIERAVLEAITDAAPHVTVRQARKVAEGAVQRLEQAGHVLGR